MNQHQLRSRNFILDLALLVDFGLFLEVAQVRYRLLALHGPLEVLLLGSVMRTQIQVMQKGIALVPHIDKRRVEAGQYLSDSAQEYISNQVRFVSGIAVQLDELPVL